MKEDHTLAEIKSFQKKLHVAEIHINKSGTNAIQAPQTITRNYCLFSDRIQFTPFNIYFMWS